MDWTEGLHLKGLSKIRTKGALYEKLYKSFKAKHPGKYPKNYLAEKSGLSKNHIQLFLAGGYEEIPPEELQNLLAVIMLRDDAWRRYTTRSAIPGMGTNDPNWQVKMPAPQTPARDLEQLKIQAEESLSLPKEPHVKFVENYTEDPLIIALDPTGTLIITYNTKENVDFLKRLKVVPILLRGAVLFNEEIMPDRIKL